MKKYLFYELLNLIRTRPDLKKKVKIFVMVGLVGLIVVSGLAIWAGLSAISFVASKANAVIQAPTAQVQLENLKNQAPQLAQIQVLGCWDSAVALLQVRPWLERSASQNLQSLIQGCFPSQPWQECQGEPCPAESTNI